MISKAKYEQMKRSIRAGVNMESVYGSDWFKDMLKYTVINYE